MSHLCFVTCVHIHMHTLGHRRTYTQTNAHACTRIHASHTCTNMHTHTWPLAHPHRHMQTDRHTRIHTHTQTRTHTHKHAHTRTHTPIHSVCLLVMLSLTAQAIYERMFTWIVRKINSKVEVHDSSHRYDNNVIGVLDIYGFEIFDNNRWAGLNLQPHHCCTHCGR